MSKRILFFLCFLLALPPSLATAEEALPLEKTILQQHLTQLELERNLQLLKLDESKLNRDLAELELEAKKQELTISSKRKHAGKVARAYYMGKRNDLLTLLFSADDFNQVLTSARLLEIIFTSDMKKLESFQLELARANDLSLQKQSQLKKIRELRQMYEKRLADMIAIKLLKEENLQKLPDSSSVEALMENLIKDWRSRGLPVFQDFFGVLARVMQDLPQLITPDHIQSEGLFTHKLTITEEEFNKFLLSKDPIFQHAYFSFDHNQLEVVGNYNQVNLKIIGSYEVVSPTELRFHINKLMFDGYELPDSTAEEMAKEYNLSFYPALINPNIHVQEATLDEHKLQIKVKFNIL
ncbi:hypothetical protein GOP56_09685 [Brevibacillus sp. 7WMA2]|uniref:hypothetical protein n=1 Tax=Brevibacillus laterosporus TaxID=1465 RepID=UPI0002150048|nr:hypothetical protein C0R09_17035 [Brevibacillus laterosporus]QIC05855.1 hypothetical protein GOP56_09685 [Brevibacillus sp. 7WMA2]RJL15714.1 hypothetical protein DM460_02165 [Brevibacillus laterosporus]TPH06121.1 hypothetical protein EGH10_18950 [Brevibacillus laterosporus]CCF14711.1 putative uncharacterized protein [Brevibacillus laterosporus GI-9]